VQIQRVGIKPTLSYYLSIFAGGSYE
jgi:hypothetical protein